MKRRTNPEAAEQWVRYAVTGEEAGRTVQEILTGSLGLSRRMLQRLTRSKGFRLNDRPTHLAKQVKSGNVVAVRIAAPEESVLEPVAMELDIVFEDAELLVLNKPPFVLVHPTTARHTQTLAHGVAHHYQQRGIRTKVRPVHRIDRDTSGLVLFAGSGVTHQRLDQQLREGVLRREYLALVKGAMEDESGVIEAPIGRHPRSPQLRAVRAQGGEHALTRYQVVERFRAATLVQVELETGRTHQIRVHLAHLGHPVVGDRQYGEQGQSLLERQALHAWRLSLLHPATGDPLRCEASLPADLSEACERLRRVDAPE